MLSQILQVAIWVKHRPLISGIWSIVAPDNHLFLSCLILESVHVSLPWYSDQSLIISFLIYFLVVEDSSISFIKFKA